LLVATVPTC